jgi:WD40 repeat protein
MEQHTDEKTKREPGAEEAPHVYAVQKNLSGWHFSRRGFLTAAAAAVAGAAAGCGSATPQPTLSPEEEARMEACKDIKAHKSRVRALAVSPDGTLLASGSSDRTIKLWSLPEGALLKTLRGHSNVVEALAMRPDGMLLASGSVDETIKLWSLPEGALLKTLVGHSSAVWTLAMSSDGTLLASAGGSYVGDADSAIRLWLLPKGEFRTLEGHTSSVRALAMSPDGTLLASGSLDGTIKLWSLPEGAFASCLMDLAANRSNVEGVTYRLESASGQLLEYTLPCGSPIPAGAVCVCNCVAGGYVSPCSCVGHTAPAGHYWYPN